MGKNTQRVILAATFSLFLVSFAAIGQDDATISPKNPGTGSMTNAPQGGSAQAEVVNEGERSSRGGKILPRGDLPTRSLGEAPLPSPVSKSSVLRRIHLINQMEIRAGKLAQQKGASKRVRSFGARLVKDHTQADQKVAQVAKAEHIDLHTPIPAVDAQIKAKEEDVMLKLNAATGTGFDRIFGQRMDAGHREAIATLEKARAELKGTKTADLIAELLPHLTKHQHIAAQIEKSVAE